ncbi:uncharacterized protein [Glycine max]|uniref:uncharacterized protein n=1 Tax=Glycine max TaxID=3847 RepID=UPI0003DE8597|nr:uncharacterized protein LOC100782289 [Glycine max]|eukprot:XP_006582654.1 uncharacterized protein LOC100782289 [Glycine max]
MVHKVADLRLTMWKPPNEIALNVGGSVHGDPQTAGYGGLSQDLLAFKPLMMLTPSTPPWIALLQGQLAPASLSLSPLPFFLLPPSRHHDHNKWSDLPPRPLPWLITGPETTTDRLEDAIARLSTSQANLNERYTDLSGKVDSILDHLRLRDTHQSQSSVNTMNSHRNSVKLDIPRFDGRDPLGWSFKMNQLFQYQNTSEEEKITVASLYLNDAALSWYQWMHNNGLITSWQAFLEALESRFAPTFYDDPKGALFKLVQRGSVNDYLTDFERLANRVIGLPPPFLLSCFISGLNPELRREVLALQPISLLQATALAKLQEDKLRDRRTLMPRPYPPSSAPTNLTSKPKAPYVQRTPEEMAFCREKGLFYNCNDKWSSNHHCKGRILLFVADDSVPDSGEPEAIIPSSSSDTTISDLDLTTETTPPHISLHAMSGLPSSETFRVYDTIRNACITVLIDSGSTHNFLQPRVAHFLHLPIESTHPLRVLVGNGFMLDCDKRCPNTQLSIQSHSFSINFHLLQIRGADVVLGIEWLKQLGPITTDYTSFLMRFTHMGQEISLQADVATGPEPASVAQVKHMIHTGSTSALFHLCLLSETPTGTTTHPPPIITPIANLLLRYDKLFQPPRSLPPSREVNHRITLLPATAPVNVRAYRYPHFQKAEIERQIAELLSAGLIRSSTSPYSSPVLLVKKKDGTWRICVDYRSLNVVTVRDRFPIPTIDEVLDELDQASWFTKLDLRQGFHQILMNEADIEKTAFRTHHGHYEYLVMPFGLCNAPSTFQSAMNHLLAPFLRRFAAVFFDDILVYSNSLSSHVHHLELIFQALLRGEFYLKQAKCLFAQRELEYLGHIVSAKGVTPEPSKIKAIT